MDRQITELRRMLERWKREADRFFSRSDVANYEPNGDVSHIWSNLQSGPETVKDVLEEWGED